MSELHKVRVSQGIHNLYTGATTQNELIRKSSKYKQWREKVFQRDDFTCQICGERGGEIHADHIKQFAYFPELRFNVENGRTLCVDCHKNTDTYCRRLPT